MVSGEPAYHPARDLISVTSRNRFTAAEAYYATLFHELTHWTGHVSRLNRRGVVEPNRFGTERYSREEITAEMGAAFLCALTGTDLPVLENQAAYIAGWLRHIQDGSAADVIRAAVDAQRAVDYLTGGGDGPTPSSRVWRRARLLARTLASEHRPVFYRFLLNLRRPHSLAPAHFVAVV